MQSELQWQKWNFVNLQMIKKIDLASLYLEKQAIKTEMKFYFGKLLWM